MKTCDQCGNPVPAEAYLCPFCGGHELEVPSGALVVSRLDLGHTGLTMAEARERLSDAINVASYKGEDVLIVVHGYGSSGTGGHIRSMVRAEATRALNAGHLSGWIAGEDLGGRSHHTRNLARRLPALASLAVWQRENPGITLLVVR
ncbi:MAG: Smr/MutS family protein [Bacteroidetes bacterium]|nr:Smr/MutS family protein [Bacteroidota bacterium]